MLKPTLFVVLLSIILLGCQPAASLQPANPSPSVTTISSLPAQASKTPPQASKTPTLQPSATATALPPLVPSPAAKAELVFSVNITYDRARGEVVAFGGNHCSRSYECNETWVWNASTWQQLQLQPAPLGRSRAGFVYDEARKNSVLFGSPVHADKLSNDTWVWDGQNWQEKHPPVSPPARWGLSGNILVYDAARQVVLLLGGAVPGNPINMGMEDPINDTWLWNGQTWTQVAGVTPPIPRGGTGIYMAYDSANQVVVLVDNDTTWTWDGKTWAKQNPSHTPCTDGGAIGYDEQHHKVVFFCESNILFLPQTWVWDGKDWQQVETTHQPNVDPEMHMVYDTKHQALLLFARGVSNVWAWTGDDWQQVY